MSSTVPVSFVLNKDEMKVIGKFVGSGPLKIVFSGADILLYIKLYSLGMELNEVTFKFIADA